MLVLLLEVPREVEAWPNDFQGMAGEEVEKEEEEEVAGCP
jgi:hypothetical protein